METKSKILNVRVTDHQRSTYERAAALEGISISALLTRSADDRAEEILYAHSSMAVAREAFDRMLAALDSPAPLAPPLASALDHARFDNR